MSTTCIHCEGWGCRRCQPVDERRRKLERLLRESFHAIGSVPDGIAPRLLQLALKAEIVHELEDVP